MKKLFLTSSANEVMDDVVKRIGKVFRKRLMFILTASEVEEGDLWWLRADRKALVDVGFRVVDYTITGKTKAQVTKDLKPFDVLFFSGGNTFYLLQKMQQSHCLDIISKYVEQGKIYIGSSAGSMIAGPNIYAALRLDAIKKAPHLKGYDGLGLVNFVVFPHWGSEHFKKIYLSHRLKHAYTTNDRIILLSDYQYVRVEGDMYQIVEVKTP